MDIITYALSRQYTNTSIEGVDGVLAGKNCTIKSVVPVTGGNEITFAWTADSGTQRTTKLTVMDGEKGDQGDQGEQGIQGIQGISVNDVKINAEGHLICIMSDESEIDAGFVFGGKDIEVTYNMVKTEDKDGVATYSLQANGTDIGDPITVTTYSEEQFNKLVKQSGLVNYTENGLMSSIDKKKLDNCELMTEAVMKLEIDGMFKGMNIPPLDNDDDDGIADPEDVDDIFAPDDETADDSDIDDIFGDNP